MSIYIYMGLWWPPAASYNCAQVRHHSPAGTFTRVPGRCLRWSPTPPGPRWSPAYRYIKYKKFFTSIQTVHTHTPVTFLNMLLLLFVGIGYTCKWFLPTPQIQDTEMSRSRIKRNNYKCSPLWLWFIYSRLVFDPVRLPVTQFSEKPP